MQSRQTAREQEDRRSPLRAGFTLMELLLVLAILGTMAAITFPSVMPLFRAQKLRQGASDVQIAMSASRIHAVESAVTYQFLYEPGGRRYIVVIANADELNAGWGASDESIAGIRSDGGQLPDGLQFDEAGDLETESVEVDSTLLSGLAQPDLFEGAAWGPAIYFYPDGTATDAQFTIRHIKQEQVIRLSVRALTGGVSSADIERDEDAP